jgi:hypothetical protein
MSTWRLFRVKHHPVEGKYPVESIIPDKRAPGGFSQWGNPPKDLDGQDWGQPGELSVVAFPDEPLTYLDRKGFAVRVVNRTDVVVGFSACDSQLYLVREALDRQGNWRPIELRPIEICGNSFHRVFLGKNQYWEFPALRYSGTFKTRIRFRLEQGKSQSFPWELNNTEEAHSHTYLYPNRSGRVFYSNEFEGWINPSQFVTVTIDDD